LGSFSWKQGETKKEQPEQIKEIDGRESKLASRQVWGCNKNKGEGDQTEGIMCVKEIPKTEVI